MKAIRKNSLDSIECINWRWKSFLDYSISSLSRLQIESLPIDKEFLEKETNCALKENYVKVKTSTWACKSPKLKKIRAACIDGGNIASVLNLVINPLEDFELPFFGADLVTLPNGHLLALDLQPVLKEDSIHTRMVWEQLLPLHQHWQSMLPWGGDIPKEAQSFFSPGFLWTRLPQSKESDQLIEKVVYPAFKDYLNLYLKLVERANLVVKSRAKSLLKGQQEYLKYRADKDPARSMLTRFYGKEWTESYILNVLFN